MKATILLALLAVSLPAMHAKDLELCARVGLTRPVEGTVVQLGEQRSPVYWGWARDVHFQVCTYDGRPVSGRKRIDLLVEPRGLTPATEIVSPSTVLTDEKGRFTVTYGAGSRQPGPSWPLETTSIEQHEFRYQGRPMAVFQVERSAADLRFFRPDDTALAKNRVK